LRQGAEGKGRPGRDPEREKNARMSLAGRKTHCAGAGLKEIKLNVMRLIAQTAKGSDEPYSTISHPAKQSPVGTATVRTVGINLLRPRRKGKRRRHKSLQTEEGKGEIVGEVEHGADFSHKPPKYFLERIPLANQE